MTEEIYQVWERLASHEETAWSRDRLVSATVGAGGEVRGLWLDPRIYRVADAARLAATIAGTIRDAAGQAQRRAFETMAPLLGPHASASAADLAFDPVLHHLDATKGSPSWTWTPPR
ncbi:YbaB/EbfC family nucleoid-associated protein [Actinoplanes sp. NPDC051470]|uniref:YbaB/EbfC family nucleoid-associated protein n=1 Tax=Actinoplanes sp. NPDC051470 TaxID=3157224 RepID=UPI00342C01E0